VIAFSNFLNIFSIAELRRKIFFTLGVLIVYRLGNFVPIVGVNIEALSQFMTKSGLLSGFFSYMDMISGGGLSGGSIFALGISPYISASIAMQILTISIPTLEALSKEGDYGRKILNQYTRYLSVGIAVMQSMTYLFALEKNGLALDPGWTFRLTAMFLMVVGSVFCMWLGEQISLFGLGNGSSMLIFAGIVARFPRDIATTFINIQAGYLGMGLAIFIFALILLIICTIIFLEKGERRIPVQYTRRVVGNKVYSGQGAFIPFKINNAGVMPVIYSQAMLQIPAMLAVFLASRFVIFKWVAEMFRPTGVLFNALDFILIILFSFVFLTLQFNPEELAENMKKSGGFIPGIRPGRKTADFFNYLLIRIGLVGAIYLGVLAIFPNLIYATFTLPMLSALSGTGLLIIVGVALELAAQVEAYLLENRYRGFLSVGRFKTRLGAR
jgi:preprotein translocase subunit SecY